LRPVAKGFDCALELGLELGVVPFPAGTSKTVGTDSTPSLARAERGERSEFLSGTSGSAAHGARADGVGKVGRGGTRPYRLQSWLGRFFSRRGFCAQGFDHALELRLEHGVDPLPTGETGGQPRGETRSSRKMS